jgi:hypothetical protein
MLAAIMLWRCQRAVGRSHQTAYLTRLEEAARTEEVTKRACNTSIDHLQSRLETLQNRASSAEQKLSSFVEPPQLARKEQFQAAALLLAGGHAAERVAAVLALPVSQVELVKELQKFALKAHPVPVPPESAPAAKNPRRRGKKQLPNRRARQRVRPILLTDVVRFDGAKVAKAEAAA